MKDRKDSDSCPLWLQTANAALEKKKAEIAQLIPDEKKDFYYYSQDVLLKRAKIKQAQYDKSIQTLKDQIKHLDDLVKRNNQLYQTAKEKLELEEKIEKEKLAEDKEGLINELIAWKHDYQKKLPGLNAENAKNKCPLLPPIHKCFEKTIPNDFQSLSLFIEFTGNKKYKDKLVDIMLRDNLNLKKPLNDFPKLKGLEEIENQQQDSYLKKAEKRINKCRQVGAELKAECEKELKSIDSRISDLVAETLCADELLTKAYESYKQYGHESEEARHYDTLKQVYEKSVKTKNELREKCNAITQQCQKIANHFGCHQELIQPKIESVVTKLIKPAGQFNKTLTSVFNVIKEHEKKNPQCLRKANSALENEKEINKKPIDEKKHEPEIYSEENVFNQVGMTNVGHNGNESKRDESKRDESKRDISPDKHAFSDKFDLSNLITEITEANSLLVRANDQLSNLESKHHENDCEVLRETLQKSFVLRESFKKRSCELGAEYLKAVDPTTISTSEKVSNPFNNLQRSLIEFDETLVKANLNLIKYDVVDLENSISSEIKLLNNVIQDLTDAKSGDKLSRYARLVEVHSKGINSLDKFKLLQDNLNQRYLANQSIKVLTEEECKVFQEQQKKFIKFENILKEADKHIKAHSEIALEDLFNVISRIVNDTKYWSEQVSPKWGSSSKISKTPVPTGIAEIHKLIMDKNKRNINNTETLKAIKKVCKSRIDSGIGFFAQRNLTTTDRFYRMIAGIDLNKIDKDSLTKKIDDLYDIPGLKYLDNREVRVFEASVCV